MRIHKYFKAMLSKSVIGFHPTWNLIKACIVSDLVRKHGSNEMIAYLQKLNGLPFIFKNTSTDDNFDIKTLFEQEPGHSINVFMDHIFLLCKNPINDSSDILCFRTTNDWGSSTRYESDMEYTLTKFNIQESLKKDMIKDLTVFLSLKERLQEKLKAAGRSEILKISQLNRRFHQFNLDWLKMINSQLLKKSQLTEEDEILIENPELIQNLLILISYLDTRWKKNII